jgi:hypothetical protein
VPGAECRVRIETGEITDAVVGHQRRINQQQCRVWIEAGTDLSFGRGYAAKPPEPAICRNPERAAGICSLDAPSQLLASWSLATQAHTSWKKPRLVIVVCGISAFLFPGCGQASLERATCMFRAERLAPLTGS